MSTLEHLSNEELISEFYELNKPPRTLEETYKRIKMRDEILKRLNEPWRKQKEGFMSILKEHYGFLLNHTKSSIMNREDDCSRYGNDYIVGEFIDKDNKQVKEIEELYEE